MSLPRLSLPLLRPAGLAATLIVAGVTLAACSGGSGSAPSSGASSSGVSSSSPSASASGAASADPSTIVLTGPAQKPIRWTLLSGATPTQKAVQTALQQFDAFAALQAARGVQPADAAMVAVLQNGPGTSSINPVETLAGYPGAGVVWENVALVKVTGSTALTTVCRDVRTISTTVPATLTPAPGVSLTTAHRVVDAVTYQWRFGRSAGTPASGPQRWRFLGTTSGTTGSPSIPQCETLAAAHKTWPGPASG